MKNMDILKVTDSMLKDILDITDYKTKVILRIFTDIDMSTDTVKYEDVELSYDNISDYLYVDVSCIVPANKGELMIECTR